MRPRGEKRVSERHGRWSAHRHIRVLRVAAGAVGNMAIEGDWEWNGRRARIDEGAEKNERT